MSQEPYLPPSQYPPQYPYANYGQTYADPRAAAKRASILMFVLGTLFMLCGLCFSGMSLVPFDQLQLPAETREQLRKVEQDLNGVSLNSVLIVAGTMGLIPGLTLIVLGFFVRRGGMGSIVTAIVIVSIAIIGILILIVGGLATGQAQAAGSACVWLLPLGLFILLLTWLIQAARAAPHLAAAQQQYAAQYYQYQQQQQAYQQQYRPFPPQAAPDAPRQTPPEPPRDPPTQ